MSSMGKFFFWRWSNEGEVDLYLHVPNSIKTQDEVQLIAHTKCAEKYEKNQLWSYDGERITSSLSPSYHVSVKKVELGSRVLLRRNSDDEEVPLFDKWLYDSGVIKLEEDHNLCIVVAPDGKNIVLQSTEDIMPLVKDPIMEDARTFLYDIKNDLQESDGIHLPHADDEFQDTWDKLIGNTEDIQNTWDKLMQDTEDVLRITDNILRTSDNMLKNVDDVDNLVMQDTKDFLASSNEDLLSNTGGYGPMKWSIEMIIPRSRCAATVQLSYRPVVSVDDSLCSWTLQNTIRIRRNDGKTFFCAVGWGGGGPADGDGNDEGGGEGFRGGGGGGYCGLQQDSDGTSVVEFCLLPYYYGEVQLKERKPLRKLTKDIPCPDKKLVSFRVQGKWIRRNSDKSNVDDNCEDMNDMDSNNNNDINDSSNIKDQDDVYDDNNNINNGSYSALSTDDLIYNESKQWEEHWDCSCWYSFDSVKWFLVGSLRLYQKDIPFDGRLYSFIEDRGLSMSSKGHTLLRLCEFDTMKLNIRLSRDKSTVKQVGEPAECGKQEKDVKEGYCKNSADNIQKEEENHLSGGISNVRVDGIGEDSECTSAVFSKQPDCTDKLILDKCFSGVKKSSRCFVLCTGGSTLTSIHRYLFLEKYDDCTNKPNTMLNL